VKLLCDENVDQHVVDDRRRAGHARQLDFAKPHVLRNAQEHRDAVREIDALLDADPRRGSEEYERLELLSVLVEAYEDEHFPLGGAGARRHASKCRRLHA
jgi:hypothetical protein